MDWYNLLGFDKQTTIENLKIFQSGTLIISILIFFYGLIYIIQNRKSEPHRNIGTSCIAMSQVFLSWYLTTLAYLHPLIMSFLVIYMWLGIGIFIKYGSKGFYGLQQNSKFINK